VAACESDRSPHRHRLCPYAQGFVGRAFSLARDAGGGLVVSPDGFTLVHRAAIILLAARNNVATVYGGTTAREGGLLSYGPDLGDIFRQAASYVDRILRGAKPAELPIQLPVKFRMALNVKTAKALGLAIPPMLLAVADDRIRILATQNNWTAEGGSGSFSTFPTVRSARKFSSGVPPKAGMLARRWEDSPLGQVQTTAPQKRMGRRRARRSTCWTPSPRSQSTAPGSDARDAWVIEGLQLAQNGSDTCHIAWLERLAMRQGTRPRSMTVPAGLRENTSREFGDVETELRHIAA
jgi:ABC transporter substrate binding protein